jgi:hypothetical protein
MTLSESTLIETITWIASIEATGTSARFTVEALQAYMP